MVAELMAAAATSWWHETSGLAKARPLSYLLPSYSKRWDTYHHNTPIIIDSSTIIIAFACQNQHRPPL